MIRAIFCLDNLLAAACTAVLAGTAVIGSGCAVTKEARLGVEEAVQPRLVERITNEVGGPVELRCGIGEVCAEVKVIHVQRDVDGGVALTLMNRTGEALAVQVSLEGRDGQQRRTDRTGFHDVILAPRGEEVLDLTTTAATEDTLIVHLRPRA
jgi:hypothetical protein